MRIRHVHMKVNPTDLTSGRGMFELFDAPPTYTGALDGERLTRLLDGVRALMRDGEWRTLAEIKAVVGHSEGGIGARIRELRAMGYDFPRRRRGAPRDGLWEWRYAGHRSGIPL